MPQVLCILAWQFRHMPQLRTRSHAPQRCGGGARIYGRGWQGTPMQRVSSSASRLAELKFVCAQKNYSPGWAAHKFKEKFGSWPNGIHVEPAPASLEVQRWLRSRRIAWAKARKAA